MNIGGSLSPISSALPANAIAGLAQRSPVGEESVDIQHSTLKPVEQSAASAAGRRTDGEQATQDTTQQNRKEQLEQKLDRKMAQQESLDQQAIQQLAARDREVRNHERAPLTLATNRSATDGVVTSPSSSSLSRATASNVKIDFPNISRWAIGPQAFALTALSPEVINCV